MNDNERADMVENIEWLYLAFKQSRKSLKKWVRDNRALIDQVVSEQTNPKKR